MNYVSVIADRLAKVGIDEGKEIHIKTDYLDIFPKYKHKCYGLCKEYFDERSMSKGIWYRSIVSEPPHIPWFYNIKLSRRLVVIAHRLRSGHMPLNKFRFLIKLINSPNCEACATPEDLFHLLTECVRMQSEREKLFKELEVNRYDVGAFHHIARLLINRNKSKFKDSYFY